MNKKERLEKEAAKLYPFPDKSLYCNRGRVEELRYHVDVLEITRLREKYVAERMRTK